jgi:hypothetical protein
MADINNLAQLKSAADGTLAGGPAYTIAPGTYTLDADLLFTAAGSITHDDTAGDVIIDGNDSFNSRVQSVDFDFVGLSTSKKIVFTQGDTGSLWISGLSASIDCNFTFCDFTEANTDDGFLIGPDNNTGGIITVALNNCNAYNNQEDGISISATVIANDVFLTLHNCSGYANGVDDTDQGITTHKSNHYLNCFDSDFYDNAGTGATLSVGGQSFFKGCEFRNNGTAVKGSEIPTAETETATTWDAAGEVMTGTGSLWDTGANDVSPLDWIEILSGTNVTTGLYQVLSVASDTSMTLINGISDGSGTPSNVDYNIFAATTGQNVLQSADGRLTMEDCVFSQLPQNANKIHLQTSGAMNIIKNCKFQNTNSVTSGVRAAIQASGSGMNVIDGCSFADMTTTTSGTIYVTSTPLGTFINRCTIYNCEVGVYPEVTILVEIANSIFQGCAAAISGNSTYNDGEYEKIKANDYNCFWANTKDFIDDGDYYNDNDLQADPQFVDAAGGDFTPQNPEVIYGGMPDINGNESAIGVVQASVNNNELYKGNINSQYGKNNKQYGPE